MNNEKPKLRLGLIWWIIFPPYALYRLLRSPVKWYIKAPVLLLVFIIGLLAYDMTVSPHRVEESLAKEEVVKYIRELKKNDSVSPIASLDRFERKGFANSMIDSKSEMLVYYRAVIDQKVYYFGLNSDKDEHLKIQHIEQIYPIRMGIKGDTLRIQPEVALWLNKNEQKVGKPLKLVRESENKMIQTVKTKKDTYTFKVGNQSLYEVKDSSGKYLMKKENVLKLPSEVSNYLKSEQKKSGKFVRTLGYEVQDAGEWYYFRTDKGDFKAEVNYDGSILLKKKR